MAVLHSGEATERQCAWAAVLYAGPGAALSADAALREHGVRIPLTGALHVGVPAGRVVTGRALSRVDAPLRLVPHRLGGLDRLVHRSRPLPVVRAAPAVLHAAAWAPSDRAAEWRVAACVQQRVVRPADLRGELAAMPKLKRGALLRAVLDDVELGAHAASELDFLRFLRRAGLPAPDRLQRPVRANGLRYLDAWWERQRVVAELDGAHHRLVAEWEADVLRANQVVVAERGDRVLLLRFTTGNLRHDGPLVAAQLAAALG